MTPPDFPIPAEAIEAAAIKLAEGRLPEYSWADLDNEMREFYREDARTAIRAAADALRAYRKKDVINEV